MSHTPNRIMDARAHRGAGSSRRRYRVTRRGRIVFALVPLALIAAAATPILVTDPATLSVEGVEDGRVYGAEEAGGLSVLARTDHPDGGGRIELSVDGEPVSPQPAGAEAVEASLAALGDGDHEVVVSLDQGFPEGRLEVRRRFTIDRTPPRLEVLGPLDAVPPGEPVTVAVKVDDPAAEVRIDGQPASLDGDGVASRRYESVPTGPVPVVAVDPVGNQAESSVNVELALAGGPGGPPIRGVHATGYTWATPQLREPILQMIREGRINTVEIDLKDESGTIWYDTGVRLAHDIGAVTVLYDLRQVVEDLHAMGVRVIGRLVVFRDPILAEHAVETGRMDLVVQTPQGAVFGKYGGFTNPFSRDVWEYNIAVAEEAARLGVDDILYDYVRRPDENIERMRFPGQTGSPEDTIVAFLAESRPRVHAAGARLGASVFGVAATRPTEIAQDIPRMSEHVDYIAPMLYPSHWGPGEYGVSHPNAQPYDIVYRSLLDFQEQIAGTGATLVAWLQDFSLGVDYGPAEVRAQIQAASDAGVDDFLLWDAATTYTTAALDPGG